MHFERWKGCPPEHLKGEPQGQTCVGQTRSGRSEGRTARRRGAAGGLGSEWEARQTKGSQPQSSVTGEAAARLRGCAGRWRPLRVSSKEEDSPLTLLKSNRRSSLLGISLTSGYSSIPFSPLAFV